MNFGSSILTKGPDFVKSTCGFLSDRNDLNSEEKTLVIPGPSRR